MPFQIKTYPTDGDEGPLDTVIPDDLIVEFSLCVGNDCVDADTRFRGMAFISSYLNGDPHQTYPYSAYTTLNDSFVFPAVTSGVAKLAMFTESPSSFGFVLKAALEGIFLPLSKNGSNRVIWFEASSTESQELIALSGLGWSLLRSWV